MVTTMSLFVSTLHRKGDFTNAAGVDFTATQRNLTMSSMI